jgi:hypothetical protein
MASTACLLQTSLQPSPRLAALLKAREEAEIQVEINMARRDGANAFLDGRLDDVQRILTRLRGLELNARLKA